MRTIATTRILNLPEPSARSGPASPWIWPLPRLDGAQPRVLPPRGDRLVQLGYDDRISSSGFVPVFAPQAGVITYAVRADQRTTLCLDHPGGWSTQYGDLETVVALATDRFSRRRKVRVRAGDILGHLRTSLRLGFDLSRLIDGEWTTVEPSEVAHTWIAQPWFAEPALSASSETAA
jgi:murein DD-endopeptidase MepM/ murein hydrolase activator NlpD